MMSGCSSKDSSGDVEVLLPVWGAAFLSHSHKSLSGLSGRDRSG